MLACFRQSDLFSLSFSSVLNLKALWNCMSAVRIHKDRPSFITVDIQLLTCWRQNLLPQLIYIHPFRRFSWVYWHHWKRCIYCLKGTVLYNNNFKGSPRGTGIFDVWYINIVNCERLKQWVVTRTKILWMAFLRFSMLWIRRVATVYCYVTPWVVSNVVMLMSNVLIKSAGCKMEAVRSCQSFVNCYQPKTANIMWKPERTKPS